MENNVSSLGYWSCFFLDPGENVKRKHWPLANRTLYSCYLTTEYLTGGVAGPTVCLVLGILIAVAGLLAMISNIVNILVLRKSSASGSFQRLLIYLSGFDLMVSCFAILTSVLLKLIFDNVSRGRITLTVFKVTFLLYSLGRTGSVFITILVTMERYLAVAYPLHVKQWLSPRRSAVITGVWFLGIFCINLPWWLNSVVERNNNRYLKGRLSEYPYLFVTTWFGANVYYSNNSTVRSIHEFIDFVLPLPWLLLFNGLLYRQIHIFNKSRVALTGSQLREINTAKMFSIVVAALFSCHSFAVIDYFITVSSKVVYRELIFAIILTVTVNAMVNFFVYYNFVQAFREGFWDLYRASCLNRRRKYKSVSPPLEVMLSRSRESSEDILHETVRFTVSTKTATSDIENDHEEACRLLNVTTTNVYETTD